MHDFRYALRSLAKSRAFALTAVLTLALGIGANTAMFSVLYGVLLRPLPFNHPEQLVTVRCIQPNLDWPVVADYAEYLDWSQQTDLFSSLAVYQYENFILGTDEKPRSLFGQKISANYLATLGLSPLVGRGFTPDDCRPGAAPVAILSYSVWQSQFAGDPEVVGRVIRLAGKPTTVIGVMPRAFAGAIAGEREPEVLGPLQITLESSPRGWHYLQVFGRLQPGVSVVQAGHRMTEVAERLKIDNKSTHGVAVVDLQHWSTQWVRGRLATLMGAVGLVLLIACVNLANLSLVRVTGRTAEISVRMALGAGRWRIARTVLAENFLVGIGGGVLGCALAAVGLDFSSTFIKAQFPVMGDLGLNPTVLGFSLALTLLAATLSALVPAWRATAAWNVFMRSVGRGGSSTPQQRRLNHAFIVAQVAVTLLLLVGAGLLLRSLHRLLTQNLGFSTEQVLVFRVNLPDAAYPKPADRRAFFERLGDQLHALPGVESVSLGDSIPLQVNSNGGFLVKGSVWKHGEEPIATKLSVGPDYFKTFGIRLLQGREFATSDRDGAPHALIVNQAFVKKYLPEGNPLGREMSFEDSDTLPAQWDQVVGVVADAQIDGLDRQVTPAIYSCYLQSWCGSMQVALRTPLDAGAMLNPVRDVVYRLDKEVPITRLNPMRVLLENSVAQRRIVTWTIGVAAVVALALAVLGLYSIIAYTVAQQTREIGVRMALGAPPETVGRWVLRRGLQLVTLGIIVGVGASLALNQVIGAMLFGITPWDPVTYAAVIAILSSTAVLACWLPARRAARVDPMVALRAE
jgi:putative ABC transport system permease protein